MLSIITDTLDQLVIFPCIDAHAALLLYGQKHNSIDHDFKRSDSGSDSGLSGNGASVHPIPESGACVGEREMSIGALPAPAVPDNQETNNTAALINETVTCEMDEEDEFCVITINSKCDVHCLV